MLRLARLVRVPSWRHALGEFALIVVGVLVALWVNDLNQPRVDHTVARIWTAGQRGRGRGRSRHARS